MSVNCQNPAAAFKAPTATNLYALAALITLVTVPYQALAAGISKLQPSAANVESLVTSHVVSASTSQILLQSWHTCIPHVFLVNSQSAKLKQLRSLQVLYKSNNGTSVVQFDNLLMFEGRLIYIYRGNDLLKVDML